MHKNNAILVGPLYSTLPYRYRHSSPKTQKKNVISREYALQEFLINSLFFSMTFLSHFAIVVCYTTALRNSLRGMCIHGRIS